MTTIVYAAARQRALLGPAVRGLFGGLRRHGLAAIVLAALFVALPDVNQIAVVDYLEFMRADAAKGVTTRLGTGLAPQGVTMDAATGRLFSQNFMGRSVTALEVSALFSAGSLNLPGTPISTIAMLT